MKSNALEKTRASFGALTESQDLALIAEYNHALSNLEEYGQCSEPENIAVQKHLRKKEKSAAIARNYNGTPRSEKAVECVLFSHLLHFMLSRIAGGIASNQIRRFQERREGMKRKGTGDGKAVWLPLSRDDLQSGKDSLSALVSEDTKAEMQDAALCALASRLAECPIDFEGIKAAHRAACLVLSRHMRQHKRENATIDEIETAQFESDLLASLASQNEAIDESRRLAIQESAESMREALITYWQNSGSRKAKSGLAGELETLATALSVTLENASADTWNAKQNARTAIYERLKRMREHAHEGFQILKTRAPSMVSLHGEREEQSEHKLSSASASRILPDLRHERHERAQVTLSRTITKADRLAMGNLAKTLRQSRHECLASAWQS